MSVHDSDATMAVFLDLENIARGALEAHFPAFDIRKVLERLLLRGQIVVKKAYCDFDRYKTFKRGLHEAAFELIEIPHVRQSGKNSADIRMVVDALDLCYTKSHVDTFVIISGDSDFSPLVSKLRENAKTVIGVGVKRSTSDLLMSNCDEFIFYDDLVVKRDRPQRRRRSEPGTKAEAAAKPADKTSKEAPPVRNDAAAGAAAVRNGPAAEAPPAEPKSDEERRDEAVELVVETVDALLSERGAEG